MSGSILLGTLTDTAVQGVEGLTEGKPFDPVEAVVSGALAGAGHIAGEELRMRRGEEGEADSEREPGHAPARDPEPVMNTDQLAKLLAEARELKADPRLVHVPDDELAAILG